MFSLPDLSTTIHHKSLLGLVILATYLFNPRTFRVDSSPILGSVGDQKLLFFLITSMLAILNRKTDPSLSADERV